MLEDGAIVAAGARDQLLAAEGMKRAHLDGSEGLAARASGGEPPGPGAAGVRFS